MQTGSRLVVSVSVCIIGVLEPSAVCCRIPLIATVHQNLNTAMIQL